MSHDPLKKPDLKSTESVTTGGEKRPDVVKGALILPNGIRLTCTRGDVQSGDLETDKVQELFDEEAYRPEKGAQYHFNHEGQKFPISKEELNLSDEKITKLIFGDMQPPEDLRLREKVADVYKYFQKNAQELLADIGSLNKGTHIRRTGFKEDTIFYLVRTGDTLDVRLRVEKVGNGKFKDVHETHSMVDGIRRALAMPRAEATKKRREAAIASIDYEVAIAEGLEGVEYVAKPTKVTSPDGQSVVMYSEFCNRGDFYDLLEGDVSPLDLKRIILHTLQGVYGMHKRGICHLDLKTQNIGIRTKDGQMEPLLFDFGASAKIGEAVHPVGTLAYMSPETAEAHVKGEPIPADPKQEVFALGCMIYECLFKSNLFENEDPPLQMNKLYCEGMGKLILDTGHPIAALIANCVQYDPGKRLTMEEMIELVQNGSEESFQQRDLNQQRDPNI